MANATINVPMGTTPYGDNKIKRIPAAVAQSWYPGAMVAINSVGNGVKCDNTAGIRFDGINSLTGVLTINSDDTLATMALDQTKMLTVERPYRFTCKIAAAAAGDEGKPLYAAFDNEVSYTQTNSIFVGWVDQVLSATQVLVRPAYAGVNGTVTFDGNTLTFTGATSVNVVAIPDNLASALAFKEGSNKYIEFVTTNSAEVINLFKNLVLTDAITIVNSANVTGTSLWAAADKGAFFGATPIVIPANTVDYLAGLVNLGLRASGGTAAAAFPGIISSSSPTGGIGYATGAGGTVSQATDRTTGVTINKITGAITTQATSLAAGASVQFTVTNSAVAVGDTVIVSMRSGATNTTTSAQVVTVAAGSFKIMLVNSHASVADTGAAIINFAVVKAVSA